jgi:isoleucyl-tRNA synthetase
MPICSPSSKRSSPSSSASSTSGGAYDRDEDAYIRLYAKPNFPVLGKRVGKRMKEFQAAIQALDRDALERLQNEGQISIVGESCSDEEIQVFREARPGTGALSNRFISVVLDTTLERRQRRAGAGSRQFVQRSRKELNSASATASRSSTKVTTAIAALAEHRDYVLADLAVRLETGVPGTGAFSSEIDGRPFRYRIVRAG